MSKVGHVSLGKGEGGPPCDVFCKDTRKHPAIIPIHLHRDVLCQALCNPPSTIPVSSLLIPMLLLQVAPQILEAALIAGMKRVNVKDAPARKVNGSHGPVHAEVNRDEAEGTGEQVKAAGPPLHGPVPVLGEVGVEERVEAVNGVG